MPHVSKYIWNELPTVENGACLYLLYLITIKVLGQLRTHSETHQDLRTGVSGQVEDQSGEKREQHAGNDDVDNEIERQPQHQEMVGDVKVWCVGTAGVVNPVFPASVVL